MLEKLEEIRGKYDEIRIGSPGELVGINIYVPTVVFARLMDDYNLPAGAERSIRYSCGVQDEVINQIGLSVLSEMMSPTAAGRMLVEIVVADARGAAGACARRDGAHSAADTDTTSAG